MGYMMLLWWKVVGMVRAIPTKILVVLGVLAFLVYSGLYAKARIEQGVLLKTIMLEQTRYENTQEAIDDAIESIRGFSPDDARAWLRKHSTK
jgi:hypothetical protein